MAVGPVLALALTVSGFVLARQAAGGENPATQALVAAIQYAAPQLAAGTKDAHPTLAEVNRDLDAMVDRLLANAANGTAGAIGLGLVLLLAVMMLGRVEDALNATWRAERGRPWGERFARYCLFLMLFFLLGSASLAVFSVGAIVERASAAGAGAAAWLAHLPGGERAVGFLRGAGPELVTLALLATGLAFLYRLLPNARVRWSSALMGGLVAGALILGNQMLAAAYIGKVLEFRTLYGELGIVPVLMFGGYVSWLILLIGGQVACAFQHRRALTGRGWDGLSHRAHRSLAFVCLAETLRRHRAGTVGPTPSAIAEAARMPLGAVDACLNHLHGLGLLAPAKVAGQPEPVQVPARPLENLTVGEVWSMLDSEVDGRLEDDQGPAACAPGLESLTRRLLSSPEASVRLADLA
jgi:membrane protein